MRVLCKLFFATFFGVMTISAQRPEPTPIVPLLGNSEIDIKRSENIETPPVRLSRPIFYISENDRFLTVYLSATLKKKANLPKIQIVFFLRRKYIGLMDEVRFQRTQSEEFARNEEYVRLTTDTIDLRLPNKSNETENSEFDFAPTIIQSQNFVVDLTTEEINQLLKSNTFSMGYREIQLTATPEGLKMMKEFIEKESKSPTSIQLEINEK